MQLREYERAHDAQGKQEWQIRIRKTINETNQLNSSGLWGCREEIPHPTPGYLVQSVEAGTWLEELTNKLVSIFGSAIPVIILKID
jgi:hypothetical protein